jgi:UDP-N-acetylmuramate-alanine ligase
VVLRALMLAELMRFSKQVSRLLTHGKTTSLVASVLYVGGLDPNS